MGVEITVRRISAGNNRDRIGVEYGPKRAPLIWAAGHGGLQAEQLHGIDVLWDLVDVHLMDLTPIDTGGWYGGAMRLQHRGTDVGTPRPFQFYAGPCDVPMYTAFRDPWHGVWVVGLRSTAI